MTFWKIYVCFFSLVALFSGIGRFVIKAKKPEAVSRLDLVGAVLGIAMIPALLGFGFNRPLGPHLLWEVLVPITVLLSASELFAPKMAAMRRKIGTTKLILVIAGQILLGGPAVYAILRYTFFSPGLWV